MYNKCIRLLLSLSIALTSVSSFAEDPSVTQIAPADDALKQQVSVVSETWLKDEESARLAVSATVPLGEIGDLGARLGDNADLFKASTEPLTIYVFVPAELDPQLRTEFLTNVEEQMQKANPGRELHVQPVSIDLVQVKQERDDEFKKLERAVSELSTQFPEKAEEVKATGSIFKRLNEDTLAELIQWGRDFPSLATAYVKSRPQAAQDWWSSPFTKTKDKQIGFATGLVRATASAALWIHGNGFWSLGAAAMVPMSYFLDTWFATHERDYAEFKKAHRIRSVADVPVIKYFVRLYDEKPLIKTLILDKVFGALKTDLSEAPLLKYFVRGYNSTPILKSLAVDTVVGFLASAWFRYWNSFENPLGVSRPWSGEFLRTFRNSWLVGFAASLLGTQGPRVLRRKGYLGSRPEYYIYSSFGFLFQLGGWFLALGLDKAVIAATVLDSGFKVGLYSYARLKKWKDPRMIVIHPGVAEEEADQLMYNIGFTAGDAKSVTDEKFHEEVTELKAVMDLNWRQRTVRSMLKFKGECQDFLRRMKDPAPKQANLPPPLTPDAALPPSE